MHVLDSRIIIFLQVAALALLLVPEARYDHLVQLIVILCCGVVLCMTACPHTADMPDIDVVMKGVTCYNRNSDARV